MGWPCPCLPVRRYSTSVGSGWAGLARLGTGRSNDLRLRPRPRPRRKQIYLRTYKIRYSNANGVLQISHNRRSIDQEKESGKRKMENLSCRGWRVTQDGARFIICPNNSQRSQLSSRMKSCLHLDSRSHIHALQRSAVQCSAVSLPRVENKDDQIGVYCIVSASTQLTEERHAKATHTQSHAKSSSSV